ncbi:transglutaminase [Flavobacteriaceae bacterium F08102]|nr:transglutaminase [Flavobacteriaceae bacterium F08102]
MKQGVFLLISFLFLNQINAQNFNAVDKKVSTYPIRYETPEGLANQIKTDFTSNLEKIRAIYFWLSSNVAYDMDEYLRGTKVQNFQYSSERDKQEKIAQLNDRIISNTLLSKKAVCEGYAQTFHKVCSLLAIESAVITGYSKTDFRDIALQRAIGDHAWNAVKIDGEWKLLDVTWSAGSTRGNTWQKRFNDFFFLTDPKIFGLSHLPYEKKWQLVQTPRDQEAFFNLPLFSPPFF